MSGKPSPKGIEDLVYLCDQIEKLGAEWNELAPKKARLEEVISAHGEAKAQLKKLLVDMDIDAKGNFGWSDRMAWALCEMRRQVKPEVKVVEKPFKPITREAVLEHKKRCDDDSRHFCCFDTAAILSLLNEREQSRITHDYIRAKFSAMQNVLQGLVTSELNDFWRKKVEEVLK